MTPEGAIELIRGMVMQVVLLAAPMLGAAMLIGLAVSLFQAVTSIHEQTLSFVPKALGVLGVLVVALPWLVRTLTDYTTQLILRFPDMVR